MHRLVQTPDGVWEGQRETGRQLVADVLGMSGEKVEKEKEDRACLSVPKAATATRRGAREV